MVDVAGKLIAAICFSAIFIPNIQVVPAYILWLDRERQVELARIKKNSEYLG